jgi:hypothetical protein
MAPRLQLQSLLETITEHVYFQPPINLNLQYPCIVYERDSSSSAFADNEPYRFVWRYAVTVIDRDPDSALPDKLAALPLCTFNRHFTADDLNHDVFNIFF